MQRYFINEQQIHDNQIIIDSHDDFHHIKNVMRMDVGAQVICTDPHGSAMNCIITNISDNMVQLRIEDVIDSNQELPVRVTIVQALPKKSKLELIIQKGTELGCNTFDLFQADRSIVKWENKKAEQKLARLSKIAKEASEQCGRNKIPLVQYDAALVNVLKNNCSNYDIMLFAYEDEAKSSTYSSIGDQLLHLKEGMSIFICIGPEGGFSKDEVELMEQYHVTPVRLGPRILRTETASMYALSCISYHFEEMGCN